MLSAACVLPESGRTRVGQRQRIEPTDDWQQLDLLVRFPEQRTYELIRPVVLFGYSPAERARLTGAPQRTLYRQAARVAREGMASLFGPPKVERHRTLPEPIQRAILTLKAEHPAFHAHEIAKICGVQFGRRPSHHTVRRILAEDPLPLLVGRRSRDAPPCNPHLARRGVDGDEYRRLHAGGPAHRL
jgi:putative transposase